MRVHLTQPVARPPGPVHDAVADIDALLARMAGSRLVVVPAPGGDAWTVTLTLHGIERRGALHVTERFPGTGYRLEGEIDGLALSGLVRVGPVPENAGPQADASMLEVTLALAARSLRGRMVLASLRLMQDSLHARLAARLAVVAQAMETAD